MSEWAPMRTLAPDDPQPDGPSPLSRSTLWITAVVIVILVIGATGWTSLAAHLRDNVKASLYGPVQCRGSEVSYQPPGLPAGVGTPVITLGRSLHCTLTVRIVNEGPLSVRINSATFRYWGPRSPGIRLIGTGLSPTPDGGDAVMVVAKVLGSHQTLDVSYHLLLAPRACFDEGISNWEQDLPTISASALFLSGHRSGTGSIAWQGSPESTCHRNR